MRKALGVLVALVLLASTSGCGDPIKRYCGDLTKDRTKLSAMFESDSPTALITQLPMLKSLAGSAPDDLTDEWQTFINAIEGLSDALHQAGLKPSDYKDGKPPAGTNAAAAQAITDAADRLASPQVQDAAGGIDQEAKDVCKIDIGV